MCCPALVRKLVFGFLQESKSLSKFSCSAIVHMTSGGSLQLEPTGINCYMSTTRPGYRLSHTSCHLYVAFAFFYYAVTYNYVILADGVSEINY